MLGYVFHFAHDGLHRWPIGWVTVRTRESKYSLFIHDEIAAHLARIGLNTALAAENRVLVDSVGSLLPSRI
jgi:hypothetical protein